MVAHLLPHTASVFKCHFAGLLTKVGLCAYQVFGMVFIHDLGYTHTVLIWLAALTILIGVLSGHHPR
ncbi:MAG: hypothetical protein R2865_07570 [Deinococcales bacterium]